MATQSDLASVAPGEGPLDELLAALMQAGEVDSEGSFTLDRKEARKKMQRFQLAQPARYVLELVQAAVLRGARHINVDSDQDDLHLRCDAVPFTLTDFEELYDALFIPSRSQKKQALRHLALGASTALSMKPALVRIEGGGVTGSFLELYPGDKERMGRTAHADIGLHIHIRQRGRLGVLWRLLGYEDHRQAEFVMIREHCGLSMVPIEINGLPITVGYQLPGTMFWLTFQHGSTRGVVAAMGYLRHLVDDGALPLDYPFGLSSTLHLMRNCVSFEIDVPPLLLPGFGTLVESPSFHLDISHQRVVRNESYEEAVRLVLRQQLQLLIRECQRLQRGERSLPAHMLEGLLLGLLSRLGSLDPLLRWARRAEAGIAPLPPGFPEVVDGAAVLLSAKLWRTPQNSRVSLDDLLADLATFGTVAVTSVRARGVDRQRPLVLYIFQTRALEVFARLFPGRLEERDVQSQAAHERATNLERWRKRKQVPRLPWRPYLASVAIELNTMRGELGLEDPGADVTQPSVLDGELRMTLVHQGAVLSVKQLKVPLPGLHAVISGDFTPNYPWDDVEPDERLTIAMLALLMALPRLVDKLLAMARRVSLGAVLRELLFLSTSVSAQTQLLRQLALPTEGVSEWVPVPPLPIEQLAIVPLFRDLLGQPRTLKDLLYHYQQHGYVAVVDTADLSALTNTTQTNWVALLQHELGPQAWRKTRGSHSPAGDGLPTAAPVPVDEPPPTFVVSHRGPLSVLRETLHELIPQERILDSANWLICLSVESQTQRPAEPPATAAPSALAGAALPSAAPEPAPPADSPSPAEFPAELRLEPPSPAPAPPSSAASDEPADPPARESAAARARRVQEEELLQELRAELREVVGPAHKLLGSIDLDRIRIGDGIKPLAVICTDYQTLINRKHAAVKRVLRQVRQDPALRWFLMSAVYTALNVFFEAVTDDDEAQFLLLLNRHILRRLTGKP